MKKSFITVKNLLKKYKWNSIFFKYFKYILCFFVLPSVIIGILAFNSYSSTLKSSAVSQAEQNAQKAFVSVNDMLLETNNVYSILMNDSNVYSYLLSESVVTESPSELMRFNQINKLFNHCMMTSSFIKSIDIYSPKNKYVLSTNNSNFYEKYYNKEILSPFKEQNKHFYAVPVKYSTIAGGYTGITFGYAVINNNSPVGVIAVTVDINKIDSVLSFSDSESIVLADSQNNIIYSSSKDMIGKKLREYNESESEIVIFPKFDILQNKDTVSFVSTMTSGIKIIYENKMDYLRPAGNSIITFALIMIVLALLIPLFVSLYSSHMIYKLVVRIMSLIHTGDAPGKADNKFDEIEFISDNILNITKEKLEVEEELAKSIASLKATQSVALQMQISPHFLFNTLNVVSFIIMDTFKCENDAQRVITLLSSFLNDVLSSNETITDIKSEIETLKKYTEIELIKNNYDFDIFWDIAEDTLNLKTVKFILQPIVENALQHGIHPVEDIHGVIKIQTRIANKQLEIKVHNNGKSIPPDELLKLRDTLRLNDMPENHIGLYNVNQRIKILYGDKFGCRIHSDQSGTTVTIVQPIK